MYVISTHVLVVFKHKFAYGLCFTLWVTSKSVPLAVGLSHTHTHTLVNTPVNENKHMHTVFELY